MKSKSTYKKSNTVRALFVAMLFGGAIGVVFVLPGKADAQPLLFATVDGPSQTTPPADDKSKLKPIKTDITLDKTKPKTHDTCGNGSKAVQLSINIGCDGKGSPVTDMVFAIIRFLSNGAGILIVASLVWAGVQYTLARDDPNKVGEAKQRIMNTLGALMIFIFAYAILNYVIPAGFFN